MLLMVKTEETEEVEVLVLARLFWGIDSFEFDQSYCSFLIIVRLVDL